MAGAGGRSDLVEHGAVPAGRPVSACLHASCVSLAGRGILVRGESGAGKSQLARALIGLGAWLVADDRVVVERRPDGLIARCPGRLLGLIELRGGGILRLPAVPLARLSLVVELVPAATIERLPEIAGISILDTMISAIRVGAGSMATCAAEAVHAAALRLVSEDP